jgi:chaperonin GroES
MAVATATSIKPLGDRALVEPLEREEVTKSGLVLPDTAKEKPQEGTVVSVGSGRVLGDGTKVPMEVKKGQQVLYGKYAGTEIKIEGKDYLIVSERDILAICD